MWQCPVCKREFKTTSQHHFCEEIETIDQYILDQPEEIRPLLHKIRETIRAAAPDAVEKISWRMPTFWQHKNLIHFAAFQKHIGIYPGDEAMVFFADAMKDYHTTKGALQLPYAKPIPYDLIAEITRHRVARETEGKKHPNE